MNPNPLIFREYDIRGIADRDLTSETVTAIGKAYGTYMKRRGRKKITISRDCRVSSQRIHDALLSGILSTGLEVIDIGLTTTPCLYFSIAHLKQDGGVMITGSHNPPEHNGLKLCDGLMSVHGKDIQQLKQLIEKNDFETGKGAVAQTQVLSDYAAYIAGIFKFKRKLKVAVDCGNGMTSIVAPSLLQGFGFALTTLYAELDGRFPNHPADPSDPENLKEVIQAVKKNQSDVGLAFDGDGDRVGIIDEKGNIIEGDRLLILYARSILKTNPGATIIADVKCSNILFRDIEAHGGKALMWKTGHSLIKAKMKEVHALLAGEMSGHKNFEHRWLGFDSGIYAACRLLEIVDQANAPLSSLLSDLPTTYSTPELRTECPDERKFDIVKRAADFFKAHYQTIDLDGVRVEFPDGWGLVRASNTQPVLVMRFEAQSQKRLDEIRQLIEGKVKEFSAV